MSASRAELLRRILNQPIPIQVYRATVLSIEENRTCTVKFLSSDLEVDQVRMVAEEDAEQWGKLIPKLGSIVLVGCVDNEVTDLYLVQYGEIDGGEITIGDVLISFDQNAINLVNSKCSVAINSSSTVINQDGVTVELSDNKVKVSNNATSLTELFSDLSTLLLNLKVVTAQGPSTSLFPDTQAAVLQFQNKYKLLLS